MKFIVFGVVSLELLALGFAATEKNMTQFAKGSFP